TNAGHRPDEAAQLIEFCIELNHQIDRQHSRDSHYQPQIDPSRWDPVPLYDSRRAVAEDFVRWIQAGRPDADPWHRRYQQIAAPLSSLDDQYIAPDLIAESAARNGFGPWQAAWLLYRGIGDYAGTYALALRGTVYSAAPSVLDAPLFAPVKA